jgi:outer membrane protein assembly factor BamD (BamD/ComL family)
LRVGYGETLQFTYLEAVTIPGIEPGPRTVEGQVLLGADGKGRIFGKRYLNAERAVRTQFRMAECFFELAKEYRKMEKTELAAGAIDRGKRTLEEAMQDYPNTSLVTEGLYLLANLHQELAAEARARKDEPEALKLYQQAVSRFASIISTWPDSAYAPRAQYHKAMSLEALGDGKQATEEYVRMVYSYPDSPLIADATIRLATHFYKQAQYDVSGRIYESFARRYPNHPKAPHVMFMSAQSHMKQAETWSSPEFEGDLRLLGREIKEAVEQEYTDAAKGLDHLINAMKDVVGKELRAQSMYWCGISYHKAGDSPKAYMRLKQLTFEYPASKWARMARGYLLDEENGLDRM